MTRLQSGLFGKGPRPLLAGLKFARELATPTSRSAVFSAFQVALQCTLRCIMPPLRLPPFWQEMTATDTNRFVKRLQNGLESYNAARRESAATYVVRAQGPCVKARAKAVPCLLALRP